MKICPKCLSSYSDETLNYCLNDGVPLVVEEVIGDKLSRAKTWQEAETLRDGEFALPDFKHTTAPNNSAPTVSEPAHGTSAFAAPRKSSPVMWLAACFLLALAGGGIWYLTRAANSSAPNNSASADNKPTARQKSAAPLTPEQEAQVKKEVADATEGWRAAVERKDIDARMKFYPQTVEHFYKESDLDKTQIRAYIQRPFDLYDSIALQIDNLRIVPDALDSATATFDKSWTFKNAKVIKTGSVQQEINWTKQNGSWLISGEKDLKVYNMNNRELQSDDANQSASQNTNAAK